MQVLRDYDWLAFDPLPGRNSADGVVIRSDLEPLSVLGSRLRQILDDDPWNGLRLPVSEAAGDRCEICGIPTVVKGKQFRPDVHEKWAYEFRHGIRPMQRLVRLVALCKDCHHLQHLKPGSRDRRRDSVPFRRLCSLNGWTPDEAAADLAESVKRWRLLDLFAWSMDLSVLAGRVELPDYPDLIIPYEDRARLVELTTTARQLRRLMLRQSD